MRVEEIVRGRKIGQDRLTKRFYRGENMKYGFAITLLALAMLPAHSQVANTQKTVAASSNMEAVQTGGTTTAESALPPQAQSSISAVLGRDSQSYEISSRIGNLEAENQQQDLSAVFNTDSIHIRTGEAEFGLATLGYGYGDDLQKVRSSVPAVDQNRVEYRHGSLTEWYVNGPLGLEQGFNLAEPPARRNGKPLTIALAVSGDLEAVPDADGEGVTLKDRKGAERLRYAGLSSYDATGKQLRTWMEVQHGQLQLKVDDASAVYPVLVDPWVASAKLTASNGTKYAYFGNSVSVSTNGKIVAIGAFQTTVGSNYEQGEVYVFVEPSAGWKTTNAPTADLTYSGGAAGDSFGTSVAISGDGTTVVVGAPGANSGQGAVYVYVATTWQTTGTPNNVLTASDGQPGDSLGTSVAYTNGAAVAGADTATVGSNQYEGAAYVFVEPNGGWTGGGTLNQSAKLVAASGQEYELFGYSVAIVNNTIAVGAIQWSSPTQEQCGEAYVFIEPTNGWAGTLNENADLQVSGGLSEDNFGSAIVVSQTTAAIVVGAEGANVQGNAEQGAVYVFAKPSGGWSGVINQKAELTAKDGDQEDFFGTSVAINAGGSIIMVGSPLAPDTLNGPGPGKVYLYSEPKTGWVTTSQYTGEYKVAGGKGGTAFGISVGINSDTFVSGAFGTKVGNNVYQGEAYIWALKK
jgi:hypothetical protein